MMDSVFSSTNEVFSASASESFEMQQGRMRKPRWARHEPEYPWIIAIIGRTISALFTCIFKHFFLIIFLTGLVLRILAVTGWPPIPIKPEFLLDEISIDESVLEMWSQSHWDPRILTLITFQDCERIGQLNDWTKFFTDTLNFTWCDLSNQNFAWCQCNDVILTARIFASKAPANFHSILKRCSKLGSVSRWYPKAVFGYWEMIFYGIMAAQCYFAFDYL